MEREWDQADVYWYSSFVASQGKTTFERLEVEKERGITLVSDSDDTGRLPSIANLCPNSKRKDVSLNFFLFSEER